MWKLQYFTRKNIQSFCNHFIHENKGQFQPRNLGNDLNVFMNHFYFPLTETVQRDFSPKDKRHVYDPWGRSGAGAPIKDPEGQIQARRALHDSIVSIIIMVF